MNERGKSRLSRAGTTKGETKEETKIAPQERTGTGPFTGKREVDERRESRKKKVLEL